MRSPDSINSNEVIKKYRQDIQKKGEISEQDVNDPNLKVVNR